MGCRIWAVAVGMIAEGRRYVNGVRVHRANVICFSMKAAERLGTAFMWASKEMGVSRNLGGSFTAGHGNFKVQTLFKLEGFVQGEIQAL